MYHCLSIFALYKIREALININIKHFMQ